MWGGSRWPMFLYQTYLVLLFFNYLEIWICLFPLLHFHLCTYTCCGSNKSHIGNNNASSQHIRTTTFLITIIWLNINGQGIYIFRDSLGEPLPHPLYSGPREMIIIIKIYSPSQQKYPIYNPIGSLGSLNLFGVRLIMMTPPTYTRFHFHIPLQLFNMCVPPP